MLSRSGRPLASVLFGPIATGFVKLGISANTVTVLGTVLTCASALWFFPRGHLLLGTIITTIVVIFDNLDGQIARMTGTTSRFGAFLDSTMDRFADGAIFTSLAMWAHFHADNDARIWAVTGALAVAVIGGIIPYTRAKAESIGLRGDVGIAERADRLIGAGVIVVAMILGLSHWFFVAGMWILALLCLITVVQRLDFVRKQLAMHEGDPGAGSDV